MENKIFEDLYIREPLLTDEKIVMEYRDECVSAGIPKSVGFALKDVKCYSEWFEVIQKNKVADDIQTQYLVFRENNDKLIGLLIIRHSLKAPNLLKYSGNIGYSVRPSERKKGYATKILKIGLNICKEIGLKNALLICGEDNIGSQKCIIKNGGILEKKVPLDDGVIQLRFYIDLRI